MSDDVLGKSLDHWRRELKRADEEFARLEARRDALRRIVEGAEMLERLESSQEQTIKLPIPDEPTNGTPAPRGQEAVLRIMGERPGVLWKQRDVAREVQRRGWIDPDAKDPVASVRVTLRRLATRGDVDKVADGTYRIHVAYPPAKEVVSEE